MTSDGSPPDDKRLLASVAPLVPAWRVDRTFSYVVPESLVQRLQPGALVRVPFGGRRVRGVVLDLYLATAGEGLEEIAGLVTSVPIAPPPMDELAAWVARRYVAPRQLVLDRLVPPRVRVAVEEPVRAPRPESVAATTVGPRGLSAYTGGADLLNAIEAGRGGAWSLRPAPGADRVGLMSELVAAAGRAGAGAAVIAVPEVGAPTLAALASRFPDLARVDSAVDDSVRAAGWLRMAAGHWLAGGGRAAVLVPGPSLRLFVMEEEDHPTFKDERAPRLDARRVALERTRMQGAVCVFVGATPTLEAAHTIRSGTASVVEPPRAVWREARPVVEVAPVPAGGGIGEELFRRMRSVLQRGGNIALLASRAGFARALWCAACKRSLHCPLCEAGVSFERPSASVHCGRCGYSAPAPGECPYCGGLDWRFLGAGSERLGDQVARAFPRARVVRVDPEDPEAAARADSDIYVTTWIGTKPALRPPVSLVGVLDADALIRRPEFRAGERAHRALAEMADWAGPAASGGRLLVQTNDPAGPAVQGVARADYWFFAERELAQREELGYPPYSELIKLAAVGPGGAALLAAATEMAARTGARVLGPIAVTRRRPGNTAEERLEALLKCPDAQEVADALRGILAAAPAGARLIVDVDPR